LKNIHTLTSLIIIIFSVINCFSQHQMNMKVVLNNENKTLAINQNIIFFNQTNDTLKSLILNDWNNAYSSKKTALAKRFSDEFSRSFQLSSEKERGKTEIISIKNINNEDLKFHRLDNNEDLIEVLFDKKINPNQKIEFTIIYELKIPSSKFTNYGFNDKGEINLKDCFLSVSRYDNHTFAKYSNLNIDDCANGLSDYKIDISLPDNLQLISDLNVTDFKNNFQLTGNSRTNFSIFIQPKNQFSIYKNNIVEVVTDLKENKLDDIQKAIIINKIITFADINLGKFQYDKIIISQDDYDRNPFYGLNQLPRFMNPFHDDFIYELKYLKTYLNTYLKNSLHLDPRKDNYIYDGIQVFLMMKYMDENYPNSKMMGSIAKLKILKSFHLINLDFNEQFSYFYMLMARSNLDQAVGDSKDSFVKFNEKIAGKYRAGLSFKYLDSYLENEIVLKSIQQFVGLNQGKQTVNQDFETILKTNSPKKIDWFFETIVNSRKLIDYKISALNKTENNISITVKNKSNAAVPIPIYGLNGNEIVFKKWLEPIKTDSIFSIKNENITKLVLNYKNEVPEYDLRNNFRKTTGFFPNNRPIKLAFMKDLEDPKYNQLLYVPAFGFNLYDGLIAGMRLHNNTMLAKPFTFDIEPLYGFKSKSFMGSFSFLLNQQIRQSGLYNIRYGIFGSTAHYAPDASYTKFNPVISFNFREKDFRNNKRYSIILRQILVNRQKSNYFLSDTAENYSVFDARFGGGKNELTKQINYSSDVQFADQFGKVSANAKFRKMFDDNRQINVRLFAGSFLYRNTNSNFFSFALDRPTDYLFDYDYIGRSESSGVFSQQLIIAEGGFKTKTSDSFANQWITSLNTSGSIWNWIEVYGDIALYKNTNFNPKFVYDSGIRLNLVPDYFELYFPIYSSNGWDITTNYNQKIRFTVSLSTNTLVGLFTRKWF
jgi:hypothetical protein